MIIGLCIWSGFTFLMTFMTDYWPFLIVNGLSSAGVRVFMNLSSPIIGSLFDVEKLFLIYTIHYLSLPVGGGLGLIVPEAITNLSGDWRTSLRITPGITIFNAIIIFILLSDPPREDERIKDEDPAGGDEGKKMKKKNLLLPFGLT